MIDFRKALPIAVLVGTICAPLVLADTYFDQGRLLFDKRQFAKALPYFHKAAEDSPWDSSAAYYEALCFHQIRDWNHAKAAYKGIVEHFPGSPAYGNAIGALKVLDPAFVQAMQAKVNGTGAASVSSGSGSPGSAGGGSNDLAAMMARVIVQAPNECKIPVQKVTDKTWVDGSVNGRSFKFDFGGGDATTISTKDAKSLNLGASSGRVPVTIKVGQITLSNFPINVEDTNVPKLGTDFFAKFAYTQDPSNITATKKQGGSQSSASSWDVPFRKKGKDMLIEVQVNGRRVSVVLDQDAGENIIPRNRAREFGLEVNEGTTLNRYDADTNPTGPLRGQAGWGEEKNVTAADAKVVVGPCTSQVRFKIDDKATDAKVGSSIFGGWKLQVDPSANKIHFNH